MFHVGQLVMCVDDDPDAFVNQGAFWVGGLDGLRRGTVYTVAGLCSSPLDGIPCLILAEIRRRKEPGVRFHNEGFAAARFRPIAEDKLAVFRSLLVTPPRETIPA